MFKLIKLPAHLKTILIAANVGLARGDMLPIIVISSLFSIAHPGAIPEARQCKVTPR